MHRVSDIVLKRSGTDALTVTATLRSPELAGALQGGGLLGVLTVWGAATVVMCWFALHGAFGDTVHAFIRLGIAIAGVLWLLWNGNRLWQLYNRTTLYHLVAQCTPRDLRISGPDANFNITRTDDEIRFSSRPHRLGSQEERDERWAGHPIGYQFRDGWEVWCEAGLDVRLVTSVSGERDARAIVRHLTQANLLVTRAGEAGQFVPNRAEPA